MTSTLQKNARRAHRQLLSSCGLRPPKNSLAPERRRILAGANPGDMARRWRAVVIAHVLVGCVAGAGPGDRNPWICALL